MFSFIDGANPWAVTINLLGATKTRVLHLLFDCWEGNMAGYCFTCLRFM